MMSGSDGEAADECMWKIWKEKRNNLHLHFCLHFYFNRLQVACKNAFRAFCILALCMLYKHWTGHWTQVKINQIQMKWETKNQTDYWNYTLELKWTWLPGEHSLSHTSKTHHTHIDTSRKAIWIGFYHRKLCELDFRNDMETSNAYNIQ